MNIAQLLLFQMRWLCKKFNDNLIKTWVSLHQLNIKSLNHLPVQLFSLRTIVKQSSFFLFSSATILYIRIHVNNRSKSKFTIETCLAIFFFEYFITIRMSLSVFIFWRRQRILIIFFSKSSTTLLSRYTETYIAWSAILWKILIYDLW